MQRLTDLALQHPKSGFWLSSGLSLFLILLVALPFVMPQAGFLPKLTIDTDPENMLHESEPVRVFHNAMKREFGLNDIVVVGVINRDNPQGVFNPQTLKDVYALTEYARTLTWEEDGVQQGVVSIDLIAPSTVDHIEQAGLGTVRFEWLMSEPPQTDAEALAIADKALRIPFLNDTLVSTDRQAIALYLPLVSKDNSYRVAESLREYIGQFDHGDEYHITGLPIAQDQFGVEMFKQMAISAPIAMGLIFALLWVFFRNVRLIAAPMVVALLSVIMTMGLLVVTGNTIHIMSSMIPIFVMPIAVLDAVHILSDFFDRYPHHKDRRQTIVAVMEELNSPMLYTTLTTCAGFASLAFTPIPPVQVFGLFVAIGVAFAWLLTVTLVPAYILLMPESSLKNFGHAGAHDESRSPMTLALNRIGRFTFSHARLIVLVFVGISVAAGFGISQIRINDNPVKWFAADHPIRVADKALNERFGGTYMAYLSFRAADTPSAEAARADLLNALKTNDIAYAATRDWLNEQPVDDSRSAYLTRIESWLTQRRDSAESDADWEAWDDALLTLSAVNQRTEVFRNPAALEYLAGLQEYLQASGLVGKSNGLPDIVKTVHRELFLGEEEAYRIPDSANAVGQTLITYQSGHRPQDLWHFVTPDYRKTNLWLQLKSGDNRDMNAVVSLAEQYLEEHPAPIAIDHDWFGLTYINVIWQDKMVTGMLEAFLGSFVIVLAMMVVLFRSFWWGLLSLLPLTVTIGAIYGLIGFIGKDYDMPVAVLSALSLGLAIDYAIHFLARSRFLQAQTGSWRETSEKVFGEPARAITRNVIVIGVGFLPLLLAPLVPYQTVGVFISSILLFAGLATLFLLPAILTLFSKSLFANEGERS